MGFLSFIAIVLLGGLVALFVRTHQMEASPEQAEFRKGRVPHPHPDGLMRGTVPGMRQPPGGWIGKTFSAADQSGKNVFQQGATQTQKFPFRTREGKGLRDPDTAVLLIEYDIPGNPFWLRRVLDEVVETAPGQLLGKAHLRILPGIPFTVSFFRLSSSSP